MPFGKYGSLQLHKNGEVSRQLTVLCSILQQMMDTVTGRGVGRGSTSTVVVPQAVFIQILV